MNFSEFGFFTIFNISVIIVLIIDLGVFSRENHIIKFKEAVTYSIFYIALALSFYFFIYYFGHTIHGIQSIADIQHKIVQFQHPISIDGLNYTDALKVYQSNLSLEYLTGYLIEKSLSVDNIFVMVMIFMAFSVNPIYYKRVLFWGIVGALLMRFTFIFTASALIQNFSWVLYIFGALLIYTGVKMFLDKGQEEKIDVETHPVVRFASKYFSVYPNFVRHHFFIKRDGKRFITPLFIVLLVIEFSDVIFAVDSIPAIFSITKDPYIVYFSNIFAILGLRALFFLVINIINTFRYLKVGLSILLTFIGLKMLFEHYLHQIGFTTFHSLMVILIILTTSILASVIIPKPKDSEPTV